MATVDRTIESDYSRTAIGIEVTGDPLLWIVRCGKPPQNVFRTTSSGIHSIGDSQTSYSIKVPCPSLNAVELFC